MDIDIIISRADLQTIRDALAAFTDNTSYDYDTVTKITNDLQRAREYADRLLAER